MRLTPIMLHNLIITKVPKITTQELDNDQFGFTPVSPSALLMHLLKNQADFVDTVGLSNKRPRNLSRFT